MKWTDVAIRVGFPILLGMAGWQFSRTWDQEGRVAILEVRQREVVIQQRDAATDRRQLRELIGSMREVLARDRQAERAMIERLARIETMLQREDR